MRFINVKTMKMEEFFGDQIPPYLILSHTWTANEISFQDYMWLLDHDEEVKDGIIDELPPKQMARVMAKAAELRRRSGYKKILDFANHAEEIWLKHFPSAAVEVDAGVFSRTLYIWIDTCCINKESSAELSEAINSMYLFYQAAWLCVAMLGDVALQGVDCNPELGSSRWFKRGWTLQELLATRRVDFYDMDWKFIGNRSDLVEPISTITSIGVPYLLGPYDDNYRVPQEASIAERMSWAAGRETTRSEDVAYSLMGLFDVNMPLLYGEGGNAFARLQQEIIKTTHDQTILAWGYEQPIDFDAARQSVLTPSPADFAHCGGRLRRMTTRRDPLFVQAYMVPYEMTNMGLRITLNLLQVQYGQNDPKIFAVLPVVLEHGQHICLPVAQMGSDVDGRNKGIKAIPDGTVMEKRAYEQPIALNIPKTALIVRKSVILRSSTSPSGQSIPCGPAFVVLVEFAQSTPILEIWCPNMELSRFPQTPGSVMLEGPWEAHRRDPCPLLLRVRSESGFSSRQYVVAVTSDLEGPSPSVARVRIFDWDTVRVSTTPSVHSLVGLHLSSDAMRTTPWPELPPGKPLEVTLSPRAGSHRSARTQPGISIYFTHHRGPGSQSLFFHVATILGSL